MWAVRNLCIERTCPLRWMSASWTSACASPSGSSPPPPITLNIPVPCVGWAPSWTSTCASPTTPPITLNIPVPCVGWAPSWTSTCASPTGSSPPRLHPLHWMYLSLVLHPWVLVLPHPSPTYYTERTCPLRRMSALLNFCLCFTLGFRFSFFFLLVKPLFFAIWKKNRQHEYPGFNSGFNLCLLLICVPWLKRRPPGSLWVSCRHYPQRLLPSPRLLHLRLHLQLLRPFPLLLPPRHHWKKSKHIWEYNTYLTLSKNLIDFDENSAFTHWALILV